MRTADTRLSSCRSSSCATEAAGRANAASQLLATIAARRTLRRTGRNRGLRRSLPERALTLDQSQRVVGQDQDEQRPDHRQPDLLEPDVRTGGDGLTTERLEQRQRDVTSVQDRDGE